jgi:hypothetical protein
VGSPLVVSTDIFLFLRAGESVMELRDERRGESVTVTCTGSGESSVEGRL